ncbi:mesothelin-like protein [Sceloporus undulatus]|uniref:mesothelin-like protein n=1 Tax=Sceloporus undulatus TaxID=8520 RepID=UPI001C4BA99F|nr:mesothelin-like protein [Sceloporus undulatus]
MKIKNANLSEGQLSCMAKLLARNNLTANVSSYPPDVLLFFPLDEVDSANCKVFYTLASQGDLSLLANGSTQRTKLLENALSCFGVEDTSLSKEQLQQLGGFVCDMEAATIQDSDPGILENLKLCPDLTASQKAAFNVLLSSGKTSYGAPASWNDGSLEDLGPLAFYINRTIWDPINKRESSSSGMWPIPLTVKVLSRRQKQCSS